MLISVNGKQVDVAAEPDTALLWVLRENLKRSIRWPSGSGC